MMDSFFDIPGLDPTDAFSSAFADDLLGGDVFGLNGSGSILGLDMDMMDPFGSGPGSSSSSLLSDVFNSPTSTSGSDYGSSMSSFSAATMEDTLCEADLFQSFASAKNFAARNKVRLNNAMKVRNGGGAVRNTHNNSHHTHNSTHNNTYKKYGKHGGSRPTISMGGNNNGGGGGSSVHPKVYISTFSHNKRNGGGGGGGSSAGSGTSILLKSKRGNGGSGGSRNGRGGGGSSLISSKMSTTISSHHHQPRRSGMYGHVQQQQLQHQQQQYQQRQPKQIPKTIKFNRSGAGSGSGACYQLPGSSSISKGNVFPQKNGSCKSKNSSGSSHSSINNSRNNNNSSAANRSSFQVAAAAAAAQLQQTKVVPIPNPSADHDYCVVYTEAMFASTASNNSSDHLNSSLDDILISSSQSSNSCPNVDSFLNDHLFSLGSPSAMLNDNMNSIDGSGGSGDIHLKKGGQQSSTEVANDLEDLLDGFIPDDVLLNELPNCLQDLFDLDLNSLMDVKSEDVLDGLNDVCNLMTDNYMDDLEELYCSTFDTSSFPTPAPTPASSPAPPPMMTHLQTPNACTSTSSSSVNSVANNSIACSLPKLMSEEDVEVGDDESTLLVIPKDHEHDANSWQDNAPHTPPPTTSSCLQY
ncbi:hypothetical protein TYRP_015562 [Tyrophagus putrescentiae]|nr:hypothetical protein TYRP_015562 [Tyrophagus putrescentiae]